MAKKALIAEPDADEARKQAAILNEVGYSVSLHTSGDVIAAIETAPPDVVVLRHERPGQSGLALVGRLKRQGIASATAVVLTTSDLTPEAIRRHESQRFAADAYVRLPVSRKDLLAAAASVPEVLDAAAVAHEIPRPPPRPGKHRTGMVSAPVSRLPHGEASALSDADLAFVEDVFSNITTGITEDGNRPAKAPEVGAGLSGPDRKVALLKQSLYQREEELARLKGVWTGREEQIESAHAVYAAKDVEVAGLQLRIEELSTELEQSQTELERRTEEFGRNIGEQYDEASLREAEMIQEVARKEDELNRLRRTLRRTEDEKAENETTLKQHIFDWEKAYKAYEEHHRLVVIASMHEVQRLENAIAAREGRNKAYAVRLKEREEELARLHEKHTQAEIDLRADRHARREDVERALASADFALLYERRGRREVEDAFALVSARASDLEEQAFRVDRLLRWRDRRANADVAHIAGHARTLEAERDRLIDEARMLIREHRVLTATLSQERALGEAAIARLLEREQRTATIDGARLSHRHDLIVSLERVREDLENRIEVVTRERDTARADIEVEKDRNRDLDEALAEARVQLAETKAALEASLEQTQRDLAATTQHLHEVEAALAHAQEELAGERAARAQEREEARVVVERKDAELKDRHGRVTEIERDLQSGREDLATQRQTVAARDDRVSELLAKIREVDGANVALEGQTDRLRTQVAEGSAELEVLREQGQARAITLHAREDEIATLTKELDETRSDVVRHQGLIDEKGRENADLEHDIAEERAQAGELQASLTAETARLDDVRQQLSTKEAELGEARAEIVAGGSILDEVQREANEARKTAESIRLQWNENDIALATAEERAGANHDARLALDVALEEERTAHDIARAELASQRERGDDAESRFKALDEAQHQLRKGATKIQKELVAMSEVKRRLEEKIEEMAARIETAEQARLDAYHERNQTSAQAAEERERTAAVESERARLEAEFARVQEKAAQLEVAVEQAQAEAAQAIQTNAGASSAALEAERTARAALENDRNVAKQQLAELKAKLEQAEHAATTAQTQLVQAVQTTAALNADIDALRSDLHTTKGQLDDTASEVNEKHSASVRSAQERDAIAHDRDIALLKVGELEKNATRLNSELVTLRQQATATAAGEERSRALAQEMAQSRAAVDEERARRVAAEGKLEELKGLAHERGEESERLIEALEVQGRTLESRGHAAQESARRVHALEADLARLNSGVPADALARIERLQSELSEAQQTSMQHAAEVAQLRQELTQSQGNASILANGKNSDEERWRNAAVTSSEEAAAARDQALEAETRLSHAQQQLARLSSAYDGAQKQLQQLRSSVEPE